MMLVKHIAEKTQRRLAVLSHEASITEAAAILADATTPLAIVCDSQGAAVGVVSRTDVVKVFGSAGSHAADTNAQAIMTKDVFSCHMDQTLQVVWEGMSGRGLRCAPVLDDLQRPVGIVHARDLVRALLDEANSEELLLRDYVLGIGYQ
jgi:CBS domain-containing protein